MNLETVVRCGVTYAGCDDHHVAHPLSGIEDRKPRCGVDRVVGHVVVLSGPKAAQKGVAQRIVVEDRVRFRADPDGHVTVDVGNVVKERLSHYDWGGELKQDVVPAAADVVHHVLIVGTSVFAGTGNP